MAFLPPIRGLPRSYWFLFASAIVNKAGSFAIILLALYLKSARGLSIERAGTVVTLYGAGSLAAGPAGGAIADRLGRRIGMLAGMSLGAAAMLHLALARGFVHVALAAVTLGFLGDLYRPSLFAWVADTVPAEDRKRAYGFLYWAVNLGFACASILAGVLAKVSFTLAFSLDAATTLLCALVIAIGVPESRIPKPPKPDGAPPSVPSRSRMPYADPVFMGFVFTTFILLLVFSQGFGPLPLDLASRGVTPEEFGYLLSINGILIVLLQPLVSEPLQRMRHERVLAAAAVAIGAGFGLTAVATSLPALAGTVAIWTFGEIIHAPVAPAVVAEVAPPDRRGAYQGAYQLAWGGATFVAPLTGALVLSRFGSNTLWCACSGAAAVSAFGYLMLGPLIRRRLSKDSSSLAAPAPSESPQA